MPEFPKAASEPAPGVYLAKKIDLPQTFFAIGHLGGKIGGKDYPALTVMAGILGGGLSSRLSQQVHTRMGNARTISARWAAAPDHPGLFEISGIAKSLSTVATIQAIRQEVERIRTAEPGEEELRIARDGALDRLAFASDTRRKALDRMLSLRVLRVSRGFSATVPEGAGRRHPRRCAARGEGIPQTGRSHHSGGGKPGGFRAAAGRPGRAGAGDRYDHPRAEGRCAASTDTASLEQGKRILARLQSAVGGADKLAAVKDYSVVGEVRVSAASGGETLIETDRWMASGNLREDAERSGVQRALYTDGKSGWTARGRQSAPLLGYVLKGMQGDLFRSYFSLLLSDRVAERTVSALDENTIEISTAGGLVAQVAVNPETGLPQQISYTMARASGPPRAGAGDLHEVRRGGRRPRSL